MKIVKLFGLLLTFIVAILGTFFLWGEISVDDSEFEFEEIDSKELQKEYIAQWRKEKTWNEDLHQTQLDELDMYKNNKQISVAEYHSIRNNIYETTIVKVCEGYQEALHNAPFSDKELRDAYKLVSRLKTVAGVDTLKKGDVRISDVEKVHKYYTKIWPFVTSSHKVTPRFDTNNFNWESFKSIRENKLKEADDNRNDPLYERVKHIPKIANGLDREEVRRVVNEYEYSFYQRLVDDIITYFDNNELCRDNYNKLKAIRDQLKSETSTSSLASYCEDYEYKLSQKEEAEQSASYYYY